MEKDKFGENGDFTILEDVVSKLTGNNFQNNEGDTSFPIMDVRDQEDEDELVDFNTKNSGGFKDERTSDDTRRDGESSGDEGKEVGEEDSMGETTSDDKEDDTSGSTVDADLESTTDDIINTEIKEDKSEVAGDISELGEVEPEVAAFVQEKLFDKLGWEYNEDDALGSVDALVDYMEKIVETNSKPNYASRDIEDLNKFVSDGGNLKDFFDIQGEVDIDKIDLTAEFNQKLVIKESLKERGLSDIQADKKIQRYDDSGILEEEALDAKEYVQKVRKNKADSLLADQSKAQKVREGQQQKFYDDVNSSIDNLDNVKGIKINKADKNKLKDAILKVGSDGKTLYQKKYNENFIKNMLESAYFTLKEDTVVRDLTRQAESKATKNLKRKLETRTKKGRVSGSLESDTVNNNHKVLDVFNNFIKP